MSSLLEQAWQRVSSLPPEKQDAVAAQIFEMLEDEEAWEGFFASKREEFERMGAKALEDHRRGLTKPLDELLNR